MFSLATTRSIASSLGLLSPYCRVFASRYKSSAANAAETDVDDDDEAEACTNALVCSSFDSWESAPGTSPRAASF